MSLQQSFALTNDLDWGIGVRSSSRVLHSVSRRPEFEPLLRAPLLSSQSFLNHKSVTKQGDATLYDGRDETQKCLA